MPPKEVRKFQQKLASFFKERRLAEGLKRGTLADRAGVSSSSLRRFELQGECSLKLLLKVAAELNIIEDIMAITEKDYGGYRSERQRGYL